MIRIEDPGLFTTVQDQGRWGYQAYGVSVAGAMDRFASRIANLLAGNSEDAAVLELTLRGGRFRFAAGCFAALAGAEMAAAVDGTPVANWSCFYIPAGGELSLGWAQSGCRAYLAIAGGIDVPPVLGSRSTYTRAAIGGLEGRALRCGDQLAAGAAAFPVAAGRLDERFIPDYDGELLLRVLAGPQDDWFSEQGKATFSNSVYTISEDADRMGYRLEGPAIAHQGRPDIVSDALCQGAIQVPGHGRPIVMMADRQTTGGYAKIAAVIGPDLARLAQARPGDSLRFRFCSEAEAVDALRAERQLLRELKAALDARRRETVRRLRLTVNGQAYCVQIKESEEA